MKQWLLLIVGVLMMSHAQATSLEPIRELPKWDEFPAQLKEIPSQAPATEELSITQPELLTPEQTKTLLERLPPLPKATTTEFKLPNQPKPVPATPVTNQPFPASEAASIAPPATPKVTELNVLRFSPSGDELDSIKQVSITFNQPMVAVTSGEDASAQSAPAQLLPKIEGEWRWLDTKTLVFTPKAERLPLATSFKLIVPANTPSASGSVLKQAFNASFSTPPVAISNVYPNGERVALQPLLLLNFNQRINPKTLLHSLQLQVAGKNVELQLVSESEIQADKTLQEQVKNLPQDQWLVVKPARSLAKDTAFKLVLNKGAKSAEGSRVSSQAQTFEFKTYGDLAITSASCNWDNNCQPATPFSFELSHPLANDLNLKDWISIEPALAQFEIDNYGTYLTIRADTQPRTTYKVTFKQGLLDTYGQKLAKDLVTTFKVVDYLPQLGMNEERLITLDPSVPPQFTFISRNFRNVKWRVQQVAPQDWAAYEKLRNETDLSAEPLPTLPGKTVTEQVIALTDKINETVIKTIDLAPWLTAGKTGQLTVLLEEGEPLVKLPSPENSESNPVQKLRLMTWLQATQISLDTRSDDQQLLAWVAQLANGQPLSQAQVRYVRNQQTTSATSDTQGLALLTKPTITPSTDTEEATSSWIEAQVGDDIAFLPLTNEQYIPYLRGIRPPNPTITNANWLWHVFDDRQLYQPNEQVHIKAWLRELDSKSQLALPKAQTVSYQVFDAQDKSLAKGETKTTALGGLDFAFTLPEVVALGPARVELKLTDTPNTGVSFQHNFQIQEFRTPEFEVKVTKVSEDTVIGNTTLAAHAEAKYYTGGGLASSEIRWDGKITSSSYTPPNQSDWSFGVTQPFWGRYDYEAGASSYQNISGKTDTNGLHTLQIDLQANSVLPLTVEASASISDKNNQTYSASTSWLVHPAAQYVGLKTERYFVEQDQPLAVDLITTDIEGSAQAQQPIVVEAARLEWSNTESKLESKDIQTCTVQSDAKGLAQCSFKTPVGGQYEITATTQDKEGRRNLSRITRWVTGGKMSNELPPNTSERVAVQTLQLIPDKSTYAPSDTAQISIQAPFANAHGVATIEREGLVEHYPLAIQGTSHTLALPLKPEWMPNVHVSVVLQSSVDNKPVYATGTTELTLSTAERVLKVAVTPKDKVVTPAAETEVTVEVKQANGQAAANTEVLVMAVDEAILALANYQLANPINSFYPTRNSGVDAQYLLENVWLEPKAELKASSPAKRPMMRMAAPATVVSAVMEMGNYKGSIEADAMALMDSAGQSPTAMLQMRQNFTPLAAFIPGLTTDDQGRVTAKFKLPDNLTRYRIMAVAVSGTDHFGSGESQLTARLPLMVRPSAPRFLNFGDQFNFPVQLQNQTDEALPVQLVMNAENLELPAQGYAVSIPANQRILVQFPTKPLSAGAAWYQFAAVSPDKAYQDAARGQIAVNTPATSEAFATYGVIDQGAIQQPIKAPQDVWAQFGALQVSTSSTAMQSLTDAFLYLHNYPFECTEQVASRMLATLALQDMLQAFNVPNMPSKEAIEKSLQRDLNLLTERQNYSDGGFALWKSYGEVFPYASLHALHALIRAKAKGYALNEERWNQALDYARNINNYLNDKNYSATTRQYLVAYSLYIRTLIDEYDVESAKTLIKDAGGAAKLPTDVLAWLMPIIAYDASLKPLLEELTLALMNRVSETASGASFGDSHFAQSYLVLDSETRTNALVLDALIKTQAQSDLIPKLVKQLQARRMNGRWDNTQDNAFVLLALDQYFQTYENQTPDFIARTWLGKDYAGEHAFKGRSFESSETTIPMSWLLEHPQAQDLILDKQGTGRLYYRIGMNYAPKSLQLAAKNTGFTVERRYEAVDKPEDVKQLADGTWHIKAGARVKVHISLDAPATRYHVALVDPLPAGLEILNPVLDTTGAQTAAPEDRDWFLYWFGHQNLRTTQAEAFTTELGEGTYQYNYIARATTQGNFIVPPAKAEEMYSPETFGRSSSDKVVVE